MASPGSDVVGHALGFPDVVEAAALEASTDGVSLRRVIVVRMERGSILDERALLDFLRERVPTAVAPDVVVVADAPLPRDRTGNVNLDALYERIGYYAYTMAPRPEPPFDRGRLPVVIGAGVVAAALLAGVIALMARRAGSDPPVSAGVSVEAGSSVAPPPASPEPTAVAPTVTPTAPEPTLAPSTSLVAAPPSTLVSAPADPSEIDRELLLSESFTRGRLMPLTAPDAGPIWRESPYYSFDGLAFVGPDTPDDTPALALVDLDVPMASLEATMVGLVDGSGVVFRYVDRSNHLSLRATRNGWQVIVMIAGEDVVVSDVPIPVGADPGRVRIDDDGAGYSIFVGGSVPGLRFEDERLRGSTIVGLIAAGPLRTESRWDSLNVFGTR